ncbi:glycine-rich extracellular protein 1 isoform X6 [Carettochelys insculpta]|uniref:glycine-rich extracellular protein 1 isoform X6 n=1 Tax=Carettochelys insculpta TaxID=44489 RepID=UPI003EB87F1B
MVCWLHSSVLIWSFLPALHLGYGPQGLQPEPGAQNGFRLAPAVGVKLGKAGYGIRGGYAAGLDGYAWGAKKNPGYVHTTLPLGGYPGVGSGYLASRAQPGYGNGLGQLLYNGQTQQATPTGVGGDDGAGEYGGAGALMYRVQQSGSRALNGNGNGLGYANGGDLQANGLARGGYGRRTARQGPRGYRLTPAAYGSKEAKYGLNGFLGNGYRGHCTPRKC